MFRGVRKGVVCDCCGRALRRAFVVEIDGEEFNCGVVCAAQLLECDVGDLRAVARLYKKTGGG